MSSNKADLANVLPEELVHNSPPDKTVVVTGSFVQDTTVACNQQIDVSQLEGSHKEGDTQLVLDFMSSESDMVVVSARDRFLAAIHNFEHQITKNTFNMATRLEEKKMK